MLPDAEGPWINIGNGTVKFVTDIECLAEKYAKKGDNEETEET